MESRNERVREASTIVYKVFDGLIEAIYMIVRGILQYMTIGVFVPMAML